MKGRRKEGKREREMGEGGEERGEKDGDEKVDRS